MSTFVNNFQLKIGYTVPGVGTSRRVNNNVMCYSTLTTGVPTAFNTGAFLTAWRTSCETELRACLDYSCIIASYQVIKLDSPTYVGSVAYPALHGSYNMTPGTPAPTNLCAFCYLKTLQRGRGSWGGLHLPGLPAGAYTGNEFTGAYQMLLDALLVRLLATITDSTGNIWNMTLLSRKRSSLIPPGPPVDVVTQQIWGTVSAWDDQVKTMRRREEGLVRA